MRLAGRVFFGGLWRHSRRLVRGEVVLRRDGAPLEGNEGSSRHARCWSCPEVSRPRTAGKGAGSSRHGRSVVRVHARGPGSCNGLTLSPGPGGGGRTDGRRDIHGQRSRFNAVSKAKGRRYCEQSRQVALGQPPDGRHRSRNLAKWSDNVLIFPRSSFGGPGRSRTAGRRSRDAIAWGKLLKCVVHVSDQQAHQEQAEPNHNERSAEPLDQLGSIPRRLRTNGRHENLA